MGSLASEGSIVTEATVGSSAGSVSSRLSGDVIEGGISGWAFSSGSGCSPWDLVPPVMVSSGLVVEVGWLPGSCSDSSG